MLTPMKVTNHMTQCKSNSCFFEEKIRSVITERSGGKTKKEKKKSRMEGKLTRKLEKKSKQ